MASPVEKMEAVAFLEMSTSPLVSIIVPAYNQERFIGQRMETILVNWRPGYQLILLDDASTDGTADLLKQWSEKFTDVQLIINAENSGNPFAQWAKGLAVATGEWIWIAEGDDWVAPGFLDHLLQASRTPQVNLVWCKSWVADKNGYVSGPWSFQRDEITADDFKQDFTMDGGKVIAKWLVYENVIPNASAVIFRKKAFEAAGPFQTKIPYCSDWLLWLKIATLGDVSFVAHPYNYFRRHPGSVINLSGDYLKEWSADLAMRRAWQGWVMENSLRYQLKSVLSINRQFIKDLQSAVFHGMASKKQWRSSAKLLLSGPLKPVLMMRWLQWALTSTLGNLHKARSHSI